MNKTLRTLTHLTAGTLLSLPILANASYQDYARVLSAQPVYQTISHQVPVQSCQVQTVAYRQSGSSSNTATVVGGLIGAAIGHEMGHSKRNKQVAATAGGLLGAAIGRDASRANSGAIQYRDEQVCHTQYRTEQHRELQGYDVTYLYNGKRYHTRTSQHPGDRLPVMVDVRPARVF